MQQNTQSTASPFTDIGLMADGSSLGARHHVSQIYQCQFKDTGVTAGMYSYSFFLIRNEYWSIHAGICVATSVHV